MKLSLLSLLILLGICGQPTGSRAQLQPLPELEINRRADTLYMERTARLAKHHYQTLAMLPPTAKNDTLRFRALYHLGRLYRWRSDRRDSVLYFGNELVRQARQRGNLYFEVNGKLLIEQYYHGVERNTPQALRLNFEILSLLPDAPLYDNVRFHVNRNLGSLHGISKDYPTALRYLNRAKTLLTNDMNYPPLTTNSFRIDVEQHIGAIYKRQGNFAESETHYRLAEGYLVRSSSASEHAYVYDDLAELYMAYKHYDKALHYAKKAESIWNRVKPQNESNSWGTLACVYTGLGQDELAFRYARKVLQLPNPTKYVREQTYMALYQLYERQHDWRNVAWYFKRYIAMRDTIAEEQHSTELASMQKQAEFDRIGLQHQQARQLQAERLKNVLKQGELTQLRANARTDALTRRALLSDQQRLVETERAKTTLTRQQTQQKLQQHTYAQQAEAQKLTRTWLTTGLVGALLFTLALSVVYGKNRAQQRQIAQLNADLEQTVLTRTAELQRANEELLRKNQALKQADARIIAAQETERQRIAADLHDDLGGTLATLRRKITDGHRRFEQLEVRTTFADLEPLIQKSSDDLRRIAHHLMPPEFARVGLRAALEQLVLAIPPYPTRVEFLASGPDRKLPVDVELNLYRIASELVQNILKHASARRASVQLLYYDSRLSLLVEDDGVGIPVHKLGQPSGIGLKNSNFRADYIGATLRRETSEGGTLFLLEWPGTLDHATYPTD